MSERLFLVLMLLGLSLSQRANAQEAASSAAFLQNGVTAHRGNSIEFPENTMAAFQSAIELGADWIELDLFLTRDGKIVVIHDKSTARVGDRALMVGESTYDQLLAVDVASDFRKRHHKSLDECPPAKIPLLEDVLRLVGTQAKTRVSLQPKVDCVAEAVAIVQKLKMERQAGFNDGNLQFMIEAKRRAPEVTIFWDRGPETDLDKDIAIAREHQFHALVLRHDGVTEVKIQKIKAAGLEAGAWTVNDPKVMHKLHNWGVQRIYTDDPRTLLRLISR